jgi:hypothetical protein
MRQSLRYVVAIVVCLSLVKIASAQERLGRQHAVEHADMGRRSEGILQEPREKIPSASPPCRATSRNLRCSENRW